MCGNYMPFNKHKLLLLTPFYDWLSVCKEKDFKKNYFSYYLFNQKLFRDEFVNNKLFNILDKSVLFENKSVYDFKSQALVIEATIKNFDKSFPTIKNNLIKMKGVLSTGFVHPEFFFICHLAIIYDIPVINYQHVEMNLYNETFMEDTETSYTNVYLFLGYGVV